MASYTTRIELINPDASDYELLHQEMRDREFYRAIDYCGLWHDLPNAEYDRTSAAALGTIYNDAGAAAQAVINNKPINDKQEQKTTILSLQKLLTEPISSRILLMWQNYPRGRVFKLVKILFGNVR